MPDDQQVSELESERRRLKAEMDQLTATAQQTEVDKAGRTVPSGDAYDAQKRLEKLNDDYRQLLIAMKPAASTVNPEIKQLDDGRFVRITPDGKATIVEGIPPTVKPQTLDSQSVSLNGRIYTIDPNNPTGDLIVRGGGATEDDQKKAADRARREYNMALTGHYATDDELLKYTTDLQKVGIDKAAAARAQTEFENSQKRLDADEARKAALQPGTIAQQGATLQSTNAGTGQTTANTGQINQNVEFAAQDQPGKLAQQTATRLGTEASTAGTLAATANQLQATQIAGAPQVQAPPTGMSQWTRDPKTGTITQGGINPEWQAKTQADVAARVGQIQQLANAKKAEVMGKVGANFTADQAYAEFNSWYDQQVAPQVGALQAAQQAAQIEQTKTQQAMRSAALTTAQTGGQQALNAYKELVGNKAASPVGPRYEEVSRQIRSAKPGTAGNVDTTGAYTWDAPNPIDLAQQGTQNALKYIDRSAAEANGLPPPDFSSIDINSMLGRERYMPAAGGGGLPPVPAMAGAGGGMAPPPAVVGGAAVSPLGGAQPYDWAGLMQRQSDDANLQRQQALMQRQAADALLQQQQRLAYDPSPYVPGG